MATTSLILYYQVRYRTAAIRDDLGNLMQSAGEWQLHPDQIHGTSVMLDGLEPSTVYEIQVRAVNEVGPGEWSEPSLSRTMDVQGAK